MIFVLIYFCIVSVLWCSLPVSSYEYVFDGGTPNAGAGFNNEWFGDILMISNPDIDGDGVADMVVHDDHVGGNWFGGFNVFFFNSDFSLKPISTKAEFGNGIGGLPADLTVVRSQLGITLTAMGDLDSDGVGDFASAAPGDTEPKQWDDPYAIGKVFIIMLQSDGYVKAYTEISSEVPNGLMTLPDLADLWGFGVESVDFNNDDTLELIVTSPGYNMRRGKVTVLFLNTDFSVQSEVIHTNNIMGLVFGYDAAAIGDVDNDGITDMIVTADFEDSYYCCGEPDPDYITVMKMNADGTEKSSVGISASSIVDYSISDRFANKAAALGDVDGDDVPDFVIGDCAWTHPSQVYAGMLYIVLLQDGGSLKRFQPISPYEGGYKSFEVGQIWWGWEVSAFDFDNNGLMEMYTHIRGKWYVMPLNHVGTISNCIVSDCSNGGVCEEAIDDRFCNCSAIPYYGETCQIYDECFSNPCANGLCIDGVGNFSCDCTDVDYLGDLCDIRIDDCGDNACQNGAPCVDENRDYSCNCSLIDYQGPFCELKIDDCLVGWHGCQNNAECIDGLRSTSCDCTGTGYVGEFCDTIDYTDDCIVNPCQHNGICEDLGVLTASCDCAGTGYSGALCTDIDLTDDCASNPCENGGNCSDTGVFSFECDCVSTGYAGATCSVPDYTDDCDVTAENLCGAGVCADVGVFSVMCNCSGTGYMGAFCDEISFEDDCVNGTCGAGICTDIGFQAFSCNCNDTGSVGATCEIPDYEDDCVSSPCMNNGLCVDTGVRSFECECSLIDFEGPLCETQIDDCVNSTCENGGLCYDGVRDYSCDCSGVDYTGTYCELFLDDCESSGCNNGGACFDGLRTFLCDCNNTGYVGETCSEPDLLDDCLTNPCNGGTCEDLGVFNYTCDCSNTDFQGDVCAERIDDCEVNDCLNNGACIDGFRSYTCDCSVVDYTGRFCDAKTDDCIGHVCQNNGTCVDGVNSYTCDCSDVHWHGEFCEIISCNVGVQIDDITCDCNGTDTLGRYCETNDTSCTDLGLASTFGFTATSVVNVCPLNGECIDCGLSCVECHGVTQAVNGEFVACSPVESCYTIAEEANGLTPICQPNYQGDSCRDCIDNHYRESLDTGCIQCPEPGALTYVLFIGVIFAVIAFVLFISQFGTYAFNFISIGSQFVQIFVMYVSLSLQWPKAVKDVANSFSVVMLEFDGFGGASCLFGNLSENDAYAFVTVSAMLLPIVMLCVLYMVYAVMKKHMKVKGTEGLSQEQVQTRRETEAWAGLTRRLIMILQMAYIPIIVRLWAHFDCVMDEELGEPVVANAIYISCNSDQWATLAVFSAMFLLGYALLIPLYFCYLLALRPQFRVMDLTSFMNDVVRLLRNLVNKKNKEKKFVYERHERIEYEKAMMEWSNKYSSLVIVFSYRHFYWSLTLMLRNFSIANLVGILGLGHPVLQALALLVVALYFLQLHFRSLPYANATLNLFDGTSQLSNIIVLCCGILMEFNVNRDALGYFVVVIFIGIVSIAFIATIQASRGKKGAIKDRLARSLQVMYPLGAVIEPMLTPEIVRANKHWGMTMDSFKSLKGEQKKVDSLEDDPNTTDVAMASAEERKKGDDLTICETKVSDLPVKIFKNKESIALSHHGSRPDVPPKHVIVIQPCAHLMQTYQKIAHSGTHSMLNTIMFWKRKQLHDNSAAYKAGVDIEAISEFVKTHPNLYAENGVSDQRWMSLLVQLYFAHSNAQPMSRKYSVFVFYSVALILLGLSGIYGLGAGAIITFGTLWVLIFQGMRWYERYRVTHAQHKYQQVLADWESVSLEKNDSDDAPNYRASVQFMWLTPEVPKKFVDVVLELLSRVSSPIQVRRSTMFIVFDEEKANARAAEKAAADAQAVEELADVCNVQLNDFGIEYFKDAFGNSVVFRGSLPRAPEEDVHTSLPCPHIAKLHDAIATAAGDANARVLAVTEFIAQHPNYLKSQGVSDTEFCSMMLQLHVVQHNVQPMSPLRVAVLFYWVAFGFIGATINYDMGLPEAVVVVVLWCALWAAAVPAYELRSSLNAIAEFREIVDLHQWPVKVNYMWNAKLGDGVSYVDMLFLLFVFPFASRRVTMFYTASINENYEQVLTIHKEDDEKSSALSPPSDEVEAAAVVVHQSTPTSVQVPGAVHDSLEAVDQKQRDTTALLRDTPVKSNKLTLAPLN